MRNAKLIIAIALVLALGLAMLLFNQAHKASEAPAGQGEKHQPAVIRMIAAQDPQTIDPQALTDTESSVFSTAVFAPITLVDSSGELRPILAESAALMLQLESADRGRAEQADVAIKLFELSQSLQDKWLTSDPSAKREILGLICLNLKLDGATLVPTMRKPFDLLVEGLLVSSSQGERI